MIELRHNTEQKIRVGVLLTKQTKLTDPLNPIFGATLDWFWWRYIVKADETVQNIVMRNWADIPDCAGCYFLTLTVDDTSVLGPLTLYLYDSSSLGRPIFMQFRVVSQMFWDAKYNNDVLSIESQPQKG